VALEAKELDGEVHAQRDMFSELVLARIEIEKGLFHLAQGQLQSLA